MLVRLLEFKFKAVPAVYRLKIEKASAEILLTSGERVLESGSIEEIFQASESEKVL